jgi:GNAT superfamily N-acetyltransferase
MKISQGSESPNIGFRDFQGHDGFDSYDKLRERLFRNYPEREFARSSYEKKDFLDSHVTRVAYVGHKLAGVILGVQTGRKFRADSFFADPAYAKYSIGKRLLESLFKDYDEVTLYAGPLSSNTGKTDFNRRTDALLRYYQRLGFVLLEDQNMIWKRKEVI